MERAAVGWPAGLMNAKERLGEALEPPPAETCLGALCKHVRGESGEKKYEPMNIHFGLLPETGLRGRVKRRAAAGPVAVGNSWLKQFPAGRTPWRISVSLAVQQIPVRLMPLAPLVLAYSIIAGSWQAIRISSERSGS